MAHQWLPAERQFVLDNADRMSDPEIAAALTRLTGRPVTVDAVRQNAGVKKGQGPAARVIRRATPGE